MKKHWLFVIFSLAVCHAALSQNVGINSTGAAPVASAMLDIASGTSGLLIPRVVLTATNAAGPITSPATSLLVYNTATAGASPNNVIPGYYYWTGAAWAALSPGTTNAWLPTGNSGTTAGTNFIGTTDAIDLVIKTNNVEKARVTSSGNVGIGTSTFDGTFPEKLIVNAGVTASVNAIAGKGSINNYLQLNIQNQSNGTGASSDVVATADNGSETTNYVDMGINSSTNASGIMGSADDAYLFNQGQNFLMGTGTAAKSLVFMTGGTSQATNERMRIDGVGNVGVGTNNPIFKFDVNGPIHTGKSSSTAGSLVYSNSSNANTLTINSGITSATYALTLPTTQGASNTMMTNDGTGVLTWTTPAAAGSAWALDGNNITALKSIGTTTNKDFPFITNNLERMRINNAGDVAIGTSNYNNTNPEQFVVDAGTTTSVNAIVGKGSINNYLQLNIQNQSAGTSASSDVVATADNGSETTNYVDMGINNSANTSSVMGAADDAYLYNIGQNFLVGTGTPAKSLIFLTGGTSETTNERMRIDGTGKVGIANIAPTEKLDVTGNVRFSGALMPNNSAGNSGDVLTSGGTGVPPTWWNPVATLSNYWVFNGNTMPSIQNFGTSNNFSLPFITNNTEQMRLFSTGGLAIGASAQSVSSPEKLLVNTGVTASVNAIVGHGTNPSYLQLNIQNLSNGNGASSDVVATADNGTETTFFVDMGINSSTNISGLMGGANDAYLYNLGQNFLIGTGTASTALVLMTGGTSQAANERMRIDGSGNVGIGNIAPNSTLSVTGSLAMTSRVGSGAYIIKITDYVVINTGGAAAWTVPQVSTCTCTGRIYRLVNQGIGNITLSQSVTTASGITTTVLPFGTTGNFEIINDGTLWRKIN